MLAPAATVSAINSEGFFGLQKHGHNVHPSTQFDAHRAQDIHHQPFLCCIIVLSGCRSLLSSQQPEQHSFMQRWHEQPAATAWNCTVG